MDVCVWWGDRSSSYYRFVFAVKERDLMRLIVFSSNISHSCELCDLFLSIGEVFFFSSGVCGCVRKGACVGICMCWHKCAHVKVCTFIP